MVGLVVQNRYLPAGRLFSNVRNFLDVINSFALINFVIQKKYEDYENFDDLQDALHQYTVAHICAKLIFLVYVVNTYIWKESYLGSAE